VQDLRRSHPLPLHHPAVQARPDLPVASARAVHWTHLARPGEVLQRAGRTQDRLWLVQTGCVTLSTPMASGGRTVLSFLGPGDVFGHEAVVGSSSSAPPIEAAALTSSRLVVMLGPEARHAFHRDPAMATWVASAIASRLASTAAVAAALAERPATGRLVWLLGELGLRWGRPSSLGIAIALPLNQELMAAAVGLTRESVNRALGDLRRRGVIVRAGRTYVLTEAEADRR
jgi:CRP/FNR family transcriptional regulator, cyclic AMP receptor protein